MSSDLVETTWSHRIGRSGAAAAITVLAALLAACGGSSPKDEVAATATTSPFPETGTAVAGGDPSQPGGRPGSGTRTTGGPRGVDPDQTGTGSNSGGPSGSTNTPSGSGEGPPSGQTGTSGSNEPLSGNVVNTPYKVPSKSEDSGDNPTTSSGSKTTEGSSMPGHRPQGVPSKPVGVLVGPTPHGPGFIPAELLLWITQASKLVEISLGPGYFPAVDGDDVVHWMPVEDRLALVARNVNDLDAEPKVLTTGRVATPVTLRNGTVVAALDPEFDAANPIMAGDASLELFKLSLAGAAPQRLTKNETAELGPALSPDGTRLAYAGQVGGDFDIIVMGFTGTRAITVTDNGWEDLFPTWSPDGTYLAFSSLQDGDFDVVAAKVAPSAVLIPLTDNAANDVSPTWSTSGITFASLRGSDFDMVRIGGTTAVASALTDGETNEQFPASSLDGSRFVFARQA